MAPPTFLLDTLAAVMIATSGYCVARLVAARVWGRALHRDVNIAHVAMGVAMAGTLVTALQTLSNGAWEVVFSALCVWFGARGAMLVVQHRRSGADGDFTHHLAHTMTHLVMSGAMLYMFADTSGAAARSGSGSMAAMGAGGRPSNLVFLTLAFLLVLFASAVWHADGLSRYTTARRVLVPAGPPGIADSALALSMVDARPGATTAATDGQPAPGDQARWLAPRLEMACHIAMCITMGYMLILIL